MQYTNLILLGLTSAVFAWFICSITRTTQSENSTFSVFQELLTAIKREAIAQWVGFTLHWSANYPLYSDLFQLTMMLFPPFNFP